MPIWRQPNGTIYRNPATCNVVNCPTSPCGVEVPCCPGVSIPRTLTLAWTGEIHHVPEDLIGGGSVALVYDSMLGGWSYSGPSPFAACAPVIGAENDILFYCDGVNWKLSISSPIGGPASVSTISVSSCSPFFGDQADELSSGGCEGYNLVGVTITE